MEKVVICIINYILEIKNIEMLDLYNKKHKLSILITTKKPDELDRTHIELKMLILPVHPV